MSQHLSTLSPQLPSLSLSLPLSLSRPPAVMIFSKTLSVAALALVAIATVLVEASPVPFHKAAPYVPVRERIYTAEQIEQHANLMKRASAGWNDYSCKPSAAHPRPLILVHGLVGVPFLFRFAHWVHLVPMS